MSGIRHLVEGQPNRKSRVDSIGTDNFNSIVERISGVNPTKLVEQVMGGGATPATAPATEAYGAPMQGTPLQHADGGVGGSVYTDPQLQHMQEEIRFLKERIAYYEDSNGPQRAGGRGAIASSSAPDIPPREHKRIEKKLAKRDKEGDLDNEDPQDEPETEMENREFKIIGIPMMEEFRNLAGLPTTPTYYGSEEPMTESFVDGYVERYDDDVVEDYQITEEEHQELWGWFLEERGLTVGGFNAFVNETFDNGNEEDAQLILTLEDEFNEGAEEMIAKIRAAKRGGQELTPKDLEMKSSGQTISARGRKSGEKAVVPFKSLAGSAKRSAVTGQKAEDLEFEADCDSDGGPDVNWKNILKKHKARLSASSPILQARKEKAEGGFGGMSRRGQ